MIAPFIRPDDEHPVQIADDQVRRLHRDLVDDAGQAQHLEQRDEADDDAARGTSRVGRISSCPRE